MQTSAAGAAAAPRMLVLVLDALRDALEVAGELLATKREAPELVLWCRAQVEVNRRRRLSHKLEMANKMN